MRISYAFPYINHFSDPTNVILWSALIGTNRGSMTLCSVPNILELYGKCMEKLFKKQRSDEIMLSEFFLYNNNSGPGLGQGMHGVAHSCQPLGLGGCVVTGKHVL